MAIGHYGIGQQIKYVDFKNKDEIPKGYEENESFDEFLGNFFEKKFTYGFNYFKIGEGNYTGEQDDYFIEIENVFSNGLNLTKKKKKFDKFIKKHRFKTIGKFGLIGGVEMT